MVVLELNPEIVTRWVIQLMKPRIACVLHLWIIYPYANLHTIHYLVVITEFVLVSSKTLNSIFHWAKRKLICQVLLCVKVLINTERLGMSVRGILWGASGQLRSTYCLFFLIILRLLLGIKLYYFRYRFYTINKSIQVCIVLLLYLSGLRSCVSAWLVSQMPSWTILGMYLSIA